MGCRMTEQDVRRWFDDQATLLQRAEYIVNQMASGSGLTDVRIGDRYLDANQAESIDISYDVHYPRCGMETESVTVPLDFLWRDDISPAIDALLTETKRLAQERLDQQARKQQALTEQRDREAYERLKKKYDPLS